MKSEYIEVIPIYPNRWHMYMEPMIQKSSNLKEFNWFVCSRPTVTPEGESVLELDRYTQFFNPLSGITYNITFDATEKEPCKVLISPFKDMNEFNTKYCGTAKQISNICSCGILCENAIFTLNVQVLEASKKCPYIEYAKSHYKFLKSHFGKGFPTNKIVFQGSPGKLSLKLKPYIDSYTNSEK